MFTFKKPARRCQAVCWLENFAMNFTIRAFDHTEADYKAWVALDNRIWTDYFITVESRRHWANTVPRKAKWRWWIAEDNGHLLATAYHGRDLYNAITGSFILNINVAPEARSQGVGASLYEHCLARLRAEHGDVHFVNGFTKEDMQDAIGFLEARGFERVLREPFSRLQVQAFDPTPFQTKLQRTEAQGIKVRTLAELQDGFTDWKEQFYRLEVDVLTDIPSADPFKAPPFVEFSRRTFEDPEFAPGTVWIAVRDRDWLGMTTLTIHDAAPDKGFTGLTGVRRAARRQGVATTLKLRALDYAQRQGVETVQTDNEENNPMFHLNLALGFQPIPARLHYRRNFKT